MDHLGGSLLGEDVCSSGRLLEAPQSSLVEARRTFPTAPGMSDC